ncbi:hypothetical protein Fot_07691 [Forsythia ovata]|uniref:Uncharacterized protein n=1 Tax=Forsythia ovata TaxID=205694 RepID=A0ABD1WWZ4_9LAMI
MQRNSVPPPPLIFPLSSIFEVALRVCRPLWSISCMVSYPEHNRLYEELSTTTERYGVELEEYKKKVNKYCSTIERLEVEVERWTKELEDLRKTPEAETLKADVRRLFDDLTATRARAQKREDKLQKEVEKKIEEINMFYIQQKSWDEGLAKKDEEVGVLNAKVKSQDLALVEMAAKVEAFQNELLNFKNSDEWK